MENIKIDNFDEALRLIWLDSIEIDDEIVSEIFNTDYQLTMSDDLKNKMMNHLEHHLMIKSLGKLLTEQMNIIGIDINNLVILTKLSNTLIKDVLEDNILTNNIPVLFVKNLLNSLNIQFDDAKQAIFRTFEIVKSKQFGAYAGFSTAQPSFRKQGSVNRTLNDWTATNTDNRELFENEDALNKYLSRLNDLMSK